MSGLISSGAKRSRIAFIGERPAWEDERAGKPFAGGAGRVLNYMFRAANIERDDVYVAHAFNRAGEPMAEALAAELQEVSPNVIVPMGGDALSLFTGDRNIKVHRGALVPATAIRLGAKLLPTYTPDAVQKDWRLLTLVVGDFIRAMGERKSPLITYPNVTLLLEPTLADVRAYAEKCIAAKKLSVDIETGWGQITCIAFAPSVEEAMCIPFVDMRKSNRCYWVNAKTELAVWKEIKRIGESNVPKMGQNFTYDISWLWQKHRVPMRNYRYDTRLQHKTMFPELPADLASMSATYTKIGSYKSWGGGYQNEVKKDG